MTARYRPILVLSSTLALAALVAPRPARAQASATAQALFDDGKALATAGRYADACPKFEESQRLDPGVGTLYRLADCWEHTGRSASAWSSYLEVASLAKAAGQPERERAARQAAQALEPKLSRLRLVVAAPEPDLTVSIDGVSLGRAAWGSAVPIDPGTHSLAARAPKKRSYEAKIEVAANAKVRVVEVPGLENESPASPLPRPPAPRAEAPGLRSQQIAALAVGGVGVVGLGVGTAFALSAKQKKNDSMAYCLEPNQCYAPGVALRNDALSAARLATVFVGAGATALAGGALLWVTTPSAKVEVGTAPSLVFVRGTW
jgi:hypothetical protein